MSCVTSGDCSGGSVACNGGYCENIPICGRPFLVNGVACRAEPVHGSDWSTHSPGGEIAALEPSVREVLAAHWTDMGLMEHASVAAFARFALELMALGAPPALLEATQASMGDEIRHARLCFGMARAYGGRSIGPGPLPVHGALGSQTAAAIVSTAFLEACVGETCAAIEAAEAAERATEPAVAAVLRRIAADETRHAELGFRFLRWALETFGADVRTAVEEALARAAAPRGREPDGETPRAPERDVLIGHGLLPAELRRAVREAALRDVALPCARALLDAEQRAAA
jgi:hypothetical protein